MYKPLNENIQHVRIENEQGDLLQIMDAAGAKFSELVNAVTANNKAGRPRVAHNQQFDARIVRIALMRYQSEESADIWKSGPAECTAVLASPICQLPPTAKMVRAGFNKFKTPNLGEAYRHFTGNELVNAHSAMADVLACRDVYFAIKGAQQ